MMEEPLVSIALHVIMHAFNWSRPLLARLAVLNDNFKLDPQVRAVSCQ